MLLSIYCILCAAFAVKLFDLLQLLTPLFSGVISPSILLFLERINVTIVNSKPHYQRCNCNEFICNYTEMT